MFNRSLEFVWHAPMPESRVTFSAKVSWVIIFVTLSESMVID